MNNYINRQIRAKEVRVVEPPLGVISFVEALKQAEESGVDLIQIASGKEPVCVLKDFGKYQYELTKKAKAAKQKVLEVKQVQIRPVTEQHDMEVKAKQVRGFLEAGHEVRLVVRLHGRELSQVAVANEALDKFIEMCECVVKQRSGLEGKQIIAMVGKK